MPRKLPLLTPDTAPFWQGGREGKLNIAHCSACEQFFHPPAPICPRCASFEVGPRAVSGHGAVSTFTVNHQPWAPDLTEPYVVAIVELPEQAGLRFVSNIVGCPPEEVHIGMAVQVRFEQVEDVWLPLFEKAALMFDRLFEKDVAISGIGQSDVGRPSSKSAMRLTLDAALEAIADAGLTRADIDGVACWPGDNQNGNSFSPVGPNALMSTLGLQVNWYGGGYEGPGPLAGIINGAMAIASGLCRHVLVFRTITEASARRVDKTAGALTNKTQGRDGSFFWQWYTPFNVLSGISLMAMYAQRHFHEYGTTPEQLAQIALTCRRNAALNPKAVFRDPMDMAQYLDSRMISTPLRLLDCDVHCDASTAIILSRVDAARHGPNPPIRLEAIGAALHQPWSWDQISLTEMACFDVGRMMWQRTDLKPKDVSQAQLYDGFSILTMLWMEGLGLCPPGESGRFVEGGQRIARDGVLPINTNGGQLSGGRTHGLGYVHEACTQLWGRGGERQLADHQVALAASGGGPLGGSVLLVRE